MCGDSRNAGRLCWVVARELDCELEEAELVWSVRWTDDECPHMAHVDIAAGDGYGEVGAALDLAQFAGDSQDALVGHGVVGASRQRFGELRIAEFVKLNSPRWPGRDY
jgi:hypothetical protein